MKHYLLCKSLFVNVNILQMETKKKLQNASWASGPVTFGSHLCVLTDQTCNHVGKNFWKKKSRTKNSAAKNKNHMTTCSLCVYRFSGSFARHSVHIANSDVTSAHVYRLKVTNKYYSLVVTFSLGHFLSLCDPVSLSALSSSHVPEDRAAWGDTQSDSNQQQNTQRFQVLIPNSMSNSKSVHCFPSSHVNLFCYHS